jgi:sirohydrochlorin cobaltochelatase
MSPPSSSAIVLFAHGARDPSWAEPFHRIAGRLGQKEPGTRVELAYLECMTPSLDSAVDALAAEGVTQITLVPLFLARGGHLKQDLPRMLEAIRREHPSLRIDLTSAIGDVEELTNAIADWTLNQHLSRSGRRRDS